MDISWYDYQACFEMKDKTKKQNADMTMRTAATDNEENSSSDDDDGTTDQPKKYEGGSRL